MWRWPRIPVNWVKGLGLALVTPQSAHSLGSPFPRVPPLRTPIGQLFGRVAADRANVFVLLFTLDAAYRALLITIVPQRAYALLGNATKVTLLYLAASCFGLMVNLCVPMLVQRWGRAAVLAAATVSALTACLLFSMGTVPALVLGLIVNTAIGAGLEAMINVAMLEHVARRDLNRFEPLRLLFAGSMFVACQIQHI